jgi:hypothetical protein
MAALLHMVCGSISGVIVFAVAGSRAGSSAERHMIQRPLAQWLLLWVVQLCKKEPEHLLPVIPCQVLQQKWFSYVQLQRHLLQDKKVGSSCQCCGLRTQYRRNKSDGFWENNLPGRPHEQQDMVHQVGMHQPDWGCAGRRAPLQPPLAPGCRPATSMASCGVNMHQLVMTCGNACVTAPAPSWTPGTAQCCCAAAARPVTMP